MADGIYGFTGQYRFLSNFYIEPDGTHVEGEYQRDKCLKTEDRARFHLRSDPRQPMIAPAQCQYLGRAVLVRYDWDAVKVDIMAEYVAQKFRDHPELRRKLKETGTLYLEETNHWSDRFWGVCGGVGQNMLGHILMEIRRSW